MSINWEEILSRLSNIKISITNESKRVLKKQVPKTKAVQDEVRDNLLGLFNSFTKIVIGYHKQFSEEQYILVKKLFTSIRDRVIRSFQVLKVPYKVPSSFVGTINKEIFDELALEETEEDNRNEPNPEESMAMSSIDFFNFASRVLTTEFDGSPSRLAAFLDAAQLVQANAQGNEENASAIVRTKLVGKARDLISEGDSLQEILRKIKNGIKGETSQSVTNKLLGLRQANKEKTQYADEIGKLAAGLKRAYISEGVPAAVAESYAANATVTALKRNAASDKDRIIMEAGNFKTQQEALDKFLSIEQGNTATICYAHHGAQGRRNFAPRGKDQRRFWNKGNGYQDHNFRRQDNRSWNWNGRDYARRTPQTRDTRFIRHYDAQDDPKNEPDPLEGPPEDQRQF